MSSCFFFFCGDIIIIVVVVFVVSFLYSFIFERKEFISLSVARIIDEDEEDESALPAGGVCTLPTLVLSDTLKTGLKRDYEGDLTRQMIESM